MAATVAPLRARSARRVVRVTPLARPAQRAQQVRQPHTCATAPVAVRQHVIRRSPRRRAPRATRPVRPPRSRRRPGQPRSRRGSRRPGGPRRPRCGARARRAGRPGSRSRRISAAASSRSSTGVIVAGLSPTRAARSRCDGASPASRAASTAAAVGVRPCRAASRRWCRATAAPTRGSRNSSGPASTGALASRCSTSGPYVGEPCGGVPFGNERPETASGRTGPRAGCSGDLSSGDPGVNSGEPDSGDPRRLRWPGDAAPAPSTPHTGTPPPAVAPPALRTRRRGADRTADASGPDAADGRPHRCRRQRPTSGRCAGGPSRCSA